MMNNEHQISAPFEKLRGHVLALLLFVLAVWAVLSGVQTVERIVHYYCALPVWDYWRTVENLGAYQHLYLPALWRQHNEHRIIFPEIIFALDMLMLHGRQTLPIMVSFFSYGLAFAVLAANFWSEKRTAAYTRVLAILLAAVVVFWQGSATVLATPFLMQWTLAQLSVVCALSFLALFTQSGHKKHLAYAIVAASVATYSSGNGLSVWPILIGGALLMRVKPSDVAILIASAIIIGGTYFIGYKFSKETHLSYLTSNPIYFLEFLGAYLGMPFTEITNYPEMTVPTMGICIGWFNCFSVVTAGTIAWRRGMLSARPALVFFGTYAFTLSTIVITAAGRMDPSDPRVGAALAPRYLTIPLLNWGVTILIYFWVFELGARLGKLVPVFAAFVAGVLALGLSSLQPWLADDATYFAKYQMVALSLQNGLMDDTLVRMIFPSFEFVRVYDRQLQENKLSIYYKYLGRWLGKSVRGYASVSTAHMPGAVAFMYPVASGVEVAGWADPSNLQRTYRWVILANEQGQIVGLGERFPAGFPRDIPAHNVPPSLGWVGFVNLRYSVQKLSVYIADAGGGLFPLAENIPLPDTAPVSLKDAGPALAGLTWSGSGPWTEARFPVVISGELPAGPIYSSWGGSDRDTGQWQSSVFSIPANHCIILPVLHGPRVDGLSVTLTDDKSSQVIATAPMEDDATRWSFWRIAIPPATERVRVTASDTGTAWGQWAAIAGPDECR